MIYKWVNNFGGFFQAHGSGYCGPQQYRKQAKLLNCVHNFLKNNVQHGLNPIAPEYYTFFWLE